MSLTGKHNLHQCIANMMIGEREEKRDLAALPEEVKQIITDALTLMAART